MQKTLLKGSLREWLLLALILITTLILVSPRLMSAFDEINAYDEAKYVVSGKSLAQGEVRDISWGLLVALIYAPLHLFLKSSPDWFILETWSGRFVLYALIWLSILLFSIRLKDHVKSFVTSGVLMFTLAIFPILENQSDALFLVLSSSNLAVTYRISKEHKLKDIGLASLLLGCAVLSRFKAVITFAAYVLVISILEWKHHKPAKLLSSVLLPGLLALFLYFVGYSLSIGLGAGAPKHNSKSLPGAWSEGAQYLVLFVLGLGIHQRTKALRLAAELREGHS
jgi:hypothetical protein